MPQIGNASQRVKLRNNKNGRIWGDTGSFYASENKKKYDASYERIFNNIKPSKAKD